MRYLVLFIIGICLYCAAALSQMTVLGLEANGPDQATQMIYQWRRTHVYQDIYEKNGFAVLIMDQGQRDKVKERLLQKDVAIVTGCGRGNSTSFHGHRGWKIFDSDDFEVLRVLRDKHLHLLSCNTAQSLMPKMLEHGAASGFSFADHFFFTFTSFNDFMEAEAAVDLALAKRQRSTIVQHRAIQAYNARIESLAKREPGAIRFLIFDRDHLRGQRRAGSIRACTCQQMPASLAHHFLFARDDNTGEFITFAQYQRVPQHAITFAEMDKATFAQMVIASYEREPRDLRVGIVSLGDFHRDRIIDEIRQGSDIGQLFVDVERHFLTVLAREWWEETVAISTTKSGELKAQGSFQAPVDLLRSISLQWRGMPETIEDVQISLNGQSVFAGSALAWEEYTVNKPIPIGKNDYVIIATGAPANVQVDVLFANCGCGEK